MRTWLLFLLLLPLPACAQTLRLDIHAAPADATIVVDREIRGTGNATVELAPGEHLIRVAGGEEWLPHTRTLNLTQDTRLDIRLEPGSVRLVEKARQLLKKGHYEEASRLLEKAARLPRQVEPWFYLGLAYWKADDPDRALAAFRRYAQYVPAWPELYLFLGDLHAQRARTAEAFTANKSALTLRPEFQEALKGLPKPTDAAIRQQGRPKDARGRIRLAQLHMLKGNLREANDWITAAVNQVYPGWRSRDWASVDVPGQEPPPNPELPVEGPQR